ncbi:unnamed protein product [Chironomus riparius]|uniref:Uncharacterized protein n=1 Tax=Chironomus riparius TaxID=315576 RepID=A0A9P0IVZ3_9DIPT|nr:unnamed protein product [Chironomus riparius]
MKRLIFTVLIILLVDGISAVAKQEKIIKKPLNLKPTKTPQKTVLEEFREHLTSEDAEFIKQIDTQFKKHGDKLSIKLERENGTKPFNKNAKRTIDDSLGYSYQQNMHDNGYYFSRPIYMHKFTSNDVAGEKGYHEKATDIEIQQSHSYEIKSENYQYQPAENQHNYNQQQQQQQVYEDPVPVIVLRVPGPAKYALHLQALLQQYLELRAAQFLKVLEEQERHGQLSRPQQYSSQDQVAYIPMVAITPMYQNNAYRYQQQQQAQQQHSHHHHNQNSQHSQHGYRQQYYQQPMRHENTYRVAVPAGEQSYYRQQQVQHHQPQHYQNYQSNVYHNVQPQISQHSQPQISQHSQSQISQHSQSQHSQPQNHHATSFITYVTPAYVTPAPQVHHEEEHPQVQHHSQHLETSENYPSDKHTHVIFKKKKNRVQNHPQPSITYHTPAPIVVPEIPAHYNHQQENQQEVEVEYHHHHEHQEHSVTHEPIYEHDDDHSAQPHVITITERTKAPFNYHVAGPTLAPTHGELRERHIPKRMAPFTKEQFEKAKRIMDKSKRSRGSTKLERVLEHPEIKASS